MINRKLEYPLNPIIDHIFLFREEHKSHARGNCAFINLKKKPADITAKENMK